ncbi:MAG: GxxExxY protein [Chitinophagaceae bacterium]|jgi:GxxExxY protein|nr:GxxExxY protein [Chitinophagaceae bacterium]MBK8309935.1 GxxExxY protein [Chitinophagaceae bacterium]MBK8606763.1 GxxExxY protein [Chitinophagaceae bacterium]MBP6478689.1 GxxExxY protein [Chitinophagaceae bacterium]MBP7108266.1 GxxExxY protein [Chitinophagaceae bacterium]
MAQSNTVKIHKPLTERERWLTSQIMDIAIGIHRFLGPGLLESVYEKCFYYELTKRNIPYLKQKCIELIYDNLIIDEGLRIDILVDDLIIIELKAQEVYHPVWEAQLLSYLKLTQKRLGYILNFHVPLMKDGVKRMIL